MNFVALLFSLVASLSGARIVANGDVNMNLKFPYDPVVMNKLALMASAASCDKDHLANNTFNCMQCEESGLKIVPGTVRSFYAKSEELYAFVMKTDGPLEAFKDTCILTIRGSANAANWFETDFDITEVKAPDSWKCPGCWLHEGFMTAWQNLEGPALYALERSGCKDSPLWITGHSMGGAISTVAAWNMKHVHGFKLAGVYTFEQPRVLCNSFADLWDKDIGGECPTFRLTYDVDPVPRMPWLSGTYQHTNHEVYYSKYTGKYTVCPNTEDGDCAGGWGPPGLIINIDAGEHCDVPYVKDACCMIPKGQRPGYKTTFMN